MLNWCLCVFNLLSSQSSLASHIILDPFLILLMPSMIPFTWFHRCKLFLDHTVCNAPKACTLHASNLLLPSFVWLCCQVDWFVDLLYLPAGSSDMFYFRALTIILSVDFVDWQDVGCCKIWTKWRQDVSFKSRLVHLINLNKTQFVFWPSLY